MPDDIFTLLIQQIPAVAILGYWIREERASHKQTKEYYRAEINKDIDELREKVDNLARQFMEFIQLR